jgi:hypothetical protein
LSPGYFRFSLKFAIKTKATSAQQVRVLIVIENSKNRHVDLVNLSDCIVIKNINKDKNNREEPLCLGFLEPLSHVLDRHILHAKNIVIAKTH